MIEGLKAKVARNDVGDAIGIRAEFHHPDGRVDCMGLSFKAPIEPHEGAINSERMNEYILNRYRDDLARWVDEVKAARG